MTETSERLAAGLEPSGGITKGPGEHLHRTSPDRANTHYMENRTTANATGNKGQFIRFLLTFKQRTQVPVPGPHLAPV